MSRTLVGNPGPREAWREESLRDSPDESNASFRFKKRIGRIDWRLISAIDPDTISRKGDISALQAVVENLTFSDVESEGVRSLADANLVKLCRIAQFCLEYLLFCQEELERQRTSACEEAQAAKVFAHEAQQKLKANSKQLSVMKKDLRDTKRTSESYARLLQLRQQPSETNQMEFLGLTCFKCHDGKIFISRTYAEAHIEKRYPQSDWPQHKAQIVACAPNLPLTTPPSAVVTVTRENDPMDSPNLASKLLDLERRGMALEAEKEALKIKCERLETDWRELDVQRRSWEESRQALLSQVARMEARNTALQMELLREQHATTLERERLAAAERVHAAEMSREREVLELRLAHLEQELEVCRADRAFALQNLASAHDVVAANLRESRAGQRILDDDSSGEEQTMVAEGVVGGAGILKTDRPSLVSAVGASSQALLRNLMQMSQLLDGNEPVFPPSTKFKKCPRGAEGIRRLERLCERLELERDLALSRLGDQAVAFKEGFKSILHLIVGCSDMCTLMADSIAIIPAQAQSMDRSLYLAVEQALSTSEALENSMQRARSSAGGLLSALQLQRDALLSAEVRLASAEQHALQAIRRATEAEAREANAEERVDAEAARAAAAQDRAAAADRRAAVAEERAVNAERQGFQLKAIFGDEQAQGSISSLYGEINRPPHLSLVSASVDERASDLSDILEHSQVKDAKAEKGVREENDQDPLPLDNSKYNVSAEDQTSQEKNFHANRRASDEDLHQNAKMQGKHEVCESEKLKQDSKLIAGERRGEVQKAPEVSDTVQEISDHASVESNRDKFHQGLEVDFCHQAKGTSPESLKSNDSPMFSENIEDFKNGNRKMHAGSNDKTEIAPVDESLKSDSIPMLSDFPQRNKNQPYRPSQPEIVSTMLVSTVSLVAEDVVIAKPNTMPSVPDAVEAAATEKRRQEQQEALRIAMGLRRPAPQPLATTDDDDLALEVETLGPGSPPPPPSMRPPSRTNSVAGVQNATRVPSTYFQDADEDRKLPSPSAVENAGVGTLQADVEKPLAKQEENGGDVVEAFVLDEEDSGWAGGPMRPVNGSVASASVDVEEVRAFGESDSSQDDSVTHVAGADAGVPSAEGVAASISAPSTVPTGARDSESDSDIETGRPTMTEINMESLRSDDHRKEFGQDECCVAKRASFSGDQNADGVNPKGGSLLTKCESTGGGEDCTRASSPAEEVRVDTSAKGSDDQSKAASIGPPEHAEDTAANTGKAKFVEAAAATVAQAQEVSWSDSDSEIESIHEKDDAERDDQRVRKNEEAAEDSSEEADEFTPRPLDFLSPERAFLPLPASPDVRAYFQHDTAAVRAARADVRRDLGDYVRAAVGVRGEGRVADAAASLPRMSEADFQRALRRVDGDLLGAVTQGSPPPELELRRMLAHRQVVSSQVDALLARRLASISVPDVSSVEPTKFAAAVTPATIPPVGSVAASILLGASVRAPSDAFPLLHDPKPPASLPSINSHFVASEELRQTESTESTDSVPPRTEQQDVTADHGNSGSFQNQPHRGPGLVPAAGDVYSASDDDSGDVGSAPSSPTRIRSSGTLGPGQLIASDMGGGVNSANSVGTGSGGEVRPSPQSSPASSLSACSQRIPPTYPAPAAAQSTTTAAAVAQSSPPVVASHPRAFTPDDSSSASEPPSLPPSLPPSAVSSPKGGEWPVGVGTFSMAGANDQNLAAGREVSAVLEKHVQASPPAQPFSAPPDLFQHPREALAAGGQGEGDLLGLDRILADRGGVHGRFEGVAVRLDASRTYDVRRPVAFAAKDGAVAAEAEDAEDSESSFGLDSLSLPFPSRSGVRTSGHNSPKALVAAKELDTPALAGGESKSNSRPKNPAEEDSGSLSLDGLLPSDSDEGEASEIDQEELDILVLQLADAPAPARRPGTAISVGSGDGPAQEEQRSARKAGMGYGALTAELVRDARAGLRKTGVDILADTTVAAATKMPGRRLGHGSGAEALDDSLEVMELLDGDWGSAQAQK